MGRGKLRPNIPQGHIASSRSQTYVPIVFITSHSVLFQDKTVEIRDDTSIITQILNAELDFLETQGIADSNHMPLEPSDEESRFVDEDDLIHYICRNCSCTRALVIPVLQEKERYLDEQGVLGGILVNRRG